MTWYVSVLIDNGPSRTVASPRPPVRRASIPRRTRSSGTEAPEKTSSSATSCQGNRSRSERAVTTTRVRSRMAAASAERMRNPCSGFSSASTITAEGERSGSWVSESGASGSTFTSSPSEEREGRASVAGRSVSRTIQPTASRA